MGAVMPKFKTYIWLSIICLMINISIFCTVLISDNTASIGNFMDSSEDDEYGFTGDLPENTNATIQNFILSSSASFVPFFSLVSLALLGGDLPLLMTTFTGVVIAIISAVQIFLLSIIILNLAPKILGTGFDV